ncbi:MAG TPA: ABC transporter permease [Candidatus Angelobacter sp.]|nr:ABC transporter permease [Candidatus Angelobacter sp.]
MTTPSNVVSESQAGTQTAALPAVFAGVRPFLWSIRRELWEYRIIYLTPLTAAVVFLFGFVVNILRVRYQMHGVWPVDPAKRHELLAFPFAVSAGLIMGTALIVGLYYSLEALYGERRDRSILFWKSLPVSDLTAVLSKFTVPLAIIPLLSLAVTIVTQFIMLLLGSVALLGSGVSVSEIWAQSSFFRLSLDFFYHIVTVHGLWYAPIYGWLFLVSAWSPRAPLVWALLPPFVIGGVEKLAFNTTYFLTLLEMRFLGMTAPQPIHPMQHASGGMQMAEQLVPVHFFTEPGLWVGLALTALFLAAAVRLRRYRGPI